MYVYTAYVAAFTFRGRVSALLATPPPLKSARDYDDIIVSYKTRNL